MQILAGVIGVEINVLSKGKKTTFVPPRKGNLYGKIYVIKGLYTL